MINNLKKVISSAAALAIVASSVSAFAATFPDVDESASYAGAVETLTALGIVEGDDNGKFNPENNVTRAEFAKMVVEARGEGAVAQAQTTTNFTDSVGHWGVGYIAQGVADGFINGYDDTTFGPDDTVTYAQAVKMLVAAIGYTTYAELQGGWPTGYLSYGNQLSITDGVAGSVSNDTALTRSQCAMLVNNALKAPLVEQGAIEMGGLTGTTPIQSSVPMDGQGKNWQTLLTRKHNAYVVKGRVDATSKTLTSLDSDQVQFHVEAADNFEDEYISKSDENYTDVIAYVGATKAEDMLFTYAEAIIQLDKDTDEYTLISISQYGANKTAEVKADLVDEDSINYMITNNVLTAFKSESSSSTTNYKLDDEVAIYINGVEYNQAFDADTITSYFCNNKTGTVTLIDATEPASTSTDGYYEYILVDFYVDAVVDTVTESSSNTRIYFKQSDDVIKGGRLQYDPEDEDITVKITKDGADVAVADLAANDVLSIAYDVNGAFDESTFYEALLSQNTVTGTVMSKNTRDESVKIDGNDYEGARGIVASNFELNTEYTLYLDVFGYIANYEEGVGSKNYGVVVGIYETAGEDYPTVRLVVTDGSIKTFVCKDDNEANYFYTVFKGVNPDTIDYSKPESAEYKYDGANHSRSEIEDTVQNNVCTYTTTTSGIKFAKYLEPKNGGPGQVFKASSNKLGSYALSDSVSTIIDINGYITGTDNAAGVMTISSFTDEAEYTAYAYDDKANDGSYRFVLVTEGTSSINPDTALAVVQDTPSQTSVDGNTYTSILVSTVKDGKATEDVEVIIDDDISSVKLDEGDVIVYTVQSNGTVDMANLVKVFDGEDDYTTLLTRVTKDGDFSHNALTEHAFNKDADILAKSANAWFKWTDNKEPEVYFGPIYQKTNNSIDLFVSADNGVSDVNSDVKDFTVDANTKSYVYDYSGRAGRGERVYTGQISSSNSSIYKGAYVDGSDEEQVNWTQDNELAANFALIKTVEGDVTEIVYFVAE